MGFKIRYDVDPALLGQGAYAGGLAKYDRSREQLGLQYASLQNQANQASANRSAQMASQARAQQNSQQNMLLNAQLQGQFADQRQSGQMDRLEFQAQNDRRMMEFQGEQKIKLGEKAYELKEQEMNATIKGIVESGWDEQTTQSAIDKVKFGFTQYEMKQPPSMQEQFDQETVVDDQGNRWGKTRSGDWRRNEAINPLAGTFGNQNINGVDVPIIYDKDGIPKAFETSDEKNKREDASNQYKRRQEAYERAVKSASANMPYKKGPDGEPGVDVDWDAYQELVKKMMKMEESVMGGHPGEGSSSPPAGEANPWLPQEQELPQDPQQPVEQPQQQQPQQPSPEGLQPESFFINQPDYQQSHDQMNPEQVQERVATLEEDIVTLMAAFDKDVNAIMQNEQYKDIYMRMRSEILFLKQTYFGEQQQ